MFYKFLFLSLIMSFFIACGSSAPVTEINPLVLKETEALVIKTPTPDDDKGVSTGGERVKEI